ncbi:hypothetical protein ACFYOV_18070 [Streptomyces sp. NPDC005931]|uniref:hypothetical protein n=1 Tax=Streptomyces sp. NPDC005931 TaxID=3364737 RepID=UPI003679B52F
MRAADHLWACRRTLDLGYYFILGATLFHLAVGRVAQPYRNGGGGPAWEQYVGTAAELGS